MSNPKRTGPIAVLESLAAMAENVEKHFITAMTLVFGLILLYNLVLRALNIQGLTWIEEFSRYMLVVTTLLGCSIAVKHKGHMVMDTAIAFLPVRSGHIIQGLGYLLCGAMYVYLGVYAWRWTGRLIRMNKSVESIDFPLWPIWVLATYAILTMGLRYLAQTVKSFGNAARGEAIVSEQDAEIARALAEEKERKKARRGGMAGKAGD
ncbi:MAG: TRAP transporter small permease [Planctomycetota bacterium]|jgi:TRAP-type C4-dicarboxylate transport system permease small subunit|nr:TRAP transporter small permease [Planctomycetota bacterium]